MTDEPKDQGPRTKDQGPRTKDQGPRTPVGWIACAAVTAAFIVVLARTAWICDDAYITYRSIDNWINGYGLRWNVAERVQTYTHPLWMLGNAAAYAVTREPYYTGLGLSVATTVAALLVLARRCATDTAVFLGVSAALVGSKAFIDFSTSGLENPLTHLLLWLFVAAWRIDSDEPRRQLAVFTVFGFALTNRHDLGALLAVPVAALAIAGRSPGTVRRLALGLAPFVAWEFFSIFYYGFPLPNTAYAKLNTGIAQAELVGQGLHYFADSWQRDPATLSAIVLWTVSISLADRQWRLPALGIAAYLSYVLLIGGDNMSGRFLTAPLALAGGAFAAIAWARPALIGAACVAGTAIAISAGPRPLPFATDAEYGVGESLELKADARTGIDDERRYYYPEMGLLRRQAGVRTEHPWALEGDGLRAGGRRVAVTGFIGLYGFYAGPAVHVVDCHALGDALLARLPADRYWRTGHYVRRLPAGYAAAVERGSGAMAEPAMRAYYARLERVTRGPLLAKGRVFDIVQLNLGNGPSAYATEASPCDDIAAFYEHVLWPNR